MQKQTTAMKVNGKENKHFSHLYGILWNQIGFNNVFQCLFSFPFLLNGKMWAEWNGMKRRTKSIQINVMS